MLNFRALTIIAASTLLLGCGSSDSGGLFGEGASGAGGSNGGAGGNAGTGNAGTGNAGTGNNGGVGNTGNTGGVGNTGNTGGVGNTGNTGGTGNVGNQGGMGNVGNQGGTGNVGNMGGTGGDPPTDATILCGNSNCDKATSFCCIQFNVTNRDFTCKSQEGECKDGSNGFPQRAISECDSAADCDGGRVCCGTLEGQGIARRYEKIACAANCGDPNDIVMCDPSKPAAGQCPSGDICRPSSLLSSVYHFCGEP